MGGPRHRHLARGNPEFLTKEYLTKENKDPDLFSDQPRGSPERTEWDQVSPVFRGETAVEHDEVVAAAVCTCWARAARIAPHRQSASRTRGRRAIPAARASTLAARHLMRIFGGDRMQNLMLRLGMEEERTIEFAPHQQAHRRGSGSRPKAQHFASRKHLLEYDDVMNKQRQAVYGMRRQLLEGTTKPSASKRFIQGSWPLQRCPLPRESHTTAY